MSPIQEREIRLSCRGVDLSLPLWRTHSLPQERGGWPGAQLQADLQAASAKRAMPPALKTKARKTLCLCPMLTQAETRSFPWDGCSLFQPCAPLHTQRSCRRGSCSCQHLSTLFLPSGRGTCHNLMSSLHWVCQASRCLFQFSTYAQIGAFFFF